MSGKVGVYNVIGIDGTRKAKISPIGIFKTTDGKSLLDKVLTSFKIIPDVIGAVYGCNITHHYLMSSKRLPVLYVLVCLNKYMRSMPMYRIYLYFDITTEVKKETDLFKISRKGRVKSKQLNGVYSMHVFMGSGGSEIDKDFVFESEESIIKKLENFTKTEMMIEILNELVHEKIVELTKQCSEEFKNIKQPTNIISLKDVDVGDYE